MSFKNKVDTFKQYSKRKNKLLMVNLHFWPDKSSCSAILFHIAKSLLNEIENIDVITSKPKRFNSSFSSLELKEIDDSTKLNIFRLPLLIERFNPLPRIINALFLGVFSFMKILFGNYQFVIATSSPPILSAFIISLATKIKKVRFIYYCMDINPEIGILSRDFKNDFLIKIMFALDKFNCKNARPVIVHSDSMKKTLLDRFINKSLDIKIINSLSVPQKSYNNSHISDENINREGLKIIYAGNIGRFQGLENIIYAFKSLEKYKDIELTFLGEGVEKSRLKKLSQKLGANINFMDYASYKKAKEIIRKSDIGLVSLVPNMHKFAYPSKTMAYLEQGIPILALIEKRSDLSKTIIKNEIGFVCDINNHKDISNLLIELNNDHSWKLNMRKYCLRTFKSEFSDNVILKKWKAIIN